MRRAPFAGCGKTPANSASILIEWWRPAVLFFGTEDFLLDGAKEYMKLAKNLNLDAKLYMSKDQKHGFFNKSPWTEATLFATDQFLQKHGYLKGQPAIDAKKGALLTLPE